jgi:hypothetical protein
VIYIYSTTVTRFWHKKYLKKKHIQKHIVEETVEDISATTVVYQL